MFPKRKGAILNKISICQWDHVTVPSLRAARVRCPISLTPSTAFYCFWGYLAGCIFAQVSQILTAERVRRCKGPGDVTFCMCNSVHCCSAPCHWLAPAKVEIWRGLMSAGCRFHIQPPFISQYFFCFKSYYGSNYWCSKGLLYHAKPFQPGLIPPSL